MAIILNDNVQVNLGKPLDNKYLQPILNRPYIDSTEVNTTIIEALRYTGLTVNISGVEYWYANGITDPDLVEKISASGGTGSGDRIEKAYTQATHGFSVGEIISWSGSTFIKSIADGSQDEAETVGFVSEVADVNNFTVVFAGYVEGISALSLSGGTTYFLSTTVAGGLTPDDTETLGTISKPILTTFTSNEALIFQYRGFEVDSGATGTAKEVINTTGLTVGVLDTNVNTLFVSSGTTTYNLPASPFEGAEVTFVDAKGTAGTTQIDINGNGNSIYDLISFTASINSNFGSITLVFNGIYWNVTAFV